MTSHAPIEQTSPASAGRTLPLILAVALFMENMDATVIATSLPAIAKDIGASPISLKLALTAYLVSLAIFIPVSGWMADRFGAKNVFRAAIGVFIAGSVACAMSGSLAAFVGARFFQGMGGAMMTPIARLVLVRSTRKSELVNAMAWLSVPALVAPVFGPPIGGFITTYFSWHWIFFINVPIGLLGISAVTRFMPGMPRSPPAPLDLPGVVLSGLAASGIVFGLSVVSLPALPPWVGLVAAALGVICAIAYFVHARRTKNPVLKLALLQNQTFRASLTGGSIFRIGIGAVPFLLPLMLQLGFGFTPFESGMITFVVALGAIVMKLAASRVFRTFGFRRVLIAGAIATAASIAALGLFTPATPVWLMMAVIFAGGFIRSVYFTGVNVFAYADIAAEDVSRATPIAAVTQQLSMALGVALAGVVLELQALPGQGPVLDDFRVAFFVMAAVSAFAALAFIRLPPDAGAAMSGHTPSPRPA